jgi:hypothetical protein
MRTCGLHLHFDARCGGDIKAVGVAILEKQSGCTRRSNPRNVKDETRKKVGCCFILLFDALSALLFLLLVSKEHNLSW